MSPFTIQCTTCDARLAVRKRSALGKIFACPNCGGMVLAERDAASVRRDDAETERMRDSRWREARVREHPATALLDSSYEVVNDILDHPPVSDQDVHPVTAPPSNAVSAPDRTRSGNESPQEPPAIESQGAGAPATRDAGVVAARSKRVTKTGKVANNHRIKYVLCTLTGAALAFGALDYFNVLSPLRGGTDEMSSAEVVALKPVSSDVDVTAANREIGARLQTHLDGLPTSASLAAFLQFVSHGSDVPIALDFDSLRYSRVGLNTRIAVCDTNASIGVMLRESLSPLGLAAELQDGLVLVTSDAAADDRVCKAHDVRDLVTAETTAEQLGVLIGDFVRAETWEAHGGTGSMQMVGDILKIDQSQRVHLDVLAFCDELRHARGLPVRGKQAAFMAAETISPRATQTLASRVDVHCPEPTRLIHALAQIEKVAGCHLLVNWQALQHAGRSFQDRVIITCDATPLEEVLTRVTDQLQLTFRMVGPSAFEITTHQAERNSDIIVFHPLIGGEQTMQRVLAALDEFELPAGPGRRFAYEPVSATMAARLPWSLQRRLADLLP